MVKIDGPRSAKIFESMVTETIGIWDQTMCRVTCPVCGAPQATVKPPYYKPVSERSTPWEGSGNLSAIPVWGECGARWEICVGEHNGACLVFTRILESCEER